MISRHVYLHFKLLIATNNNHNQSQPTLTCHLPNLSFPFAPSCFTCVYSRSPCLLAVNSKLKFSKMRNPIGPNLAHLTNRIWRRKHLVFIAIILISLIITVSYTVIIYWEKLYWVTHILFTWAQGSSISVFSPMSLFLNKQRQSSSIVHRERPSRHWITVAETKLVNEEEFNNVNPKIVIDQNREIGFDNHKLNDNPELSDSKSQVERYRALTRPYVPPLRMVHLDLKGAPPKISFLEEVSIHTIVNSIDNTIDCSRSVVSCSYEIFMFCIFIIDISSIGESWSQWAFTRIWGYVPFWGESQICSCR